MNYEAAALRQHAQAELDGLADQLARWRAEHAGRVEGASVAHEPPRPVRRAPGPPQRPQGPPLPDKLQRPRHGPDGRIIGLETYEGVGVRQVLGWEKFIADTVAAALAAERKAAGARLEAVVEALAGEVGADVGQLERRIAELEARLAALETPPVEVRDAAD